MVPLKSAVWSDDSFSIKAEEKPRLRLVSVDDEQESVSTKRSRRARARKRSRDNFWFGAMAATILVFSIGGAISSIRTDISNVISGMSSRPCVVGVTVKPGDTLWTYAHRYGAPGAYILDNVDAIARENGLDPRGALVPGQKLHIHVENPTVIAKLQNDPRVASAD